MLCEAMQGMESDCLSIKLMTIKIKCCNSSLIKSLFVINEKNAKINFRE
jgi:hypothetical protein